MTRVRQRSPVPARPVLAAVVVFLALVVPGAARAQDDPDFPREIPTTNGKIVLYEPQVESWKGDVLKARAAVAYEGKGKEPVFGVTWLTARLRTDRDAGTATIVSATVDKVRFPELTPEDEAKFRARVETAIPEWDYVIPLDRLEVTLASVEREKRAADAFKTDPPKILVEEQLAVLVLVDGEPQLRDVPGSGLKSVVNSPFALIFDPRTKSYYTSNGDFWYAAPGLSAEWKTIPKPPAEVEKLAAEAKKAAPEDEGDKKAEVEARKKYGNRPVKLVVSTEPAELLSFDGTPSYVPVTGTELLYAKNTENDVFKSVESQQTYVLLSGRWYESRTLGGPWAYVPADKLPAEFRRIPPGSAKENVLAFVAGTEQAEDALMDAEIPQTAAVNRADASLEVQYDGDPQFEPIPGTKLAHAINASTQILRSDGKYYACDQGVWYVSDRPTGPWAVSTDRPQDVDAIPPSSPAYNTKYVHIYETTPTVVYVGYTPGYVGCYPWGPTIVYGTGWYYRPWIGASYYPRPVTYGFRVGYNPWTGWNFGFGWSHGFVHFGFGWSSGRFWGPRPPYYRPHHGWWGPGGYRPPRPPGYRPPRPPHHGPPGNRPPRPAPYDSRNNIYGRKENLARNAPARGISTRPASDAARPSTRDVPRPGTTAPSTRDVPKPGTTTPSTRDVPKPGTTTPSTRDVPRPGTTAPSTRDVPRPAPATRDAWRDAPKASRPNDVFADRDGNVHRRTPDGWQSRDKGSWSRPQPQPSTRDRMPSGLNRDYQTRQRGAERSRSFGGGAPRPSAPRGGGAAPRRR